ncbi:MAG TPA: transposase [Terriglobia bacterium]|nr:transposase [Terriglobia bacterium]
MERELRSFLTCGIPAHGFARFQCESCGKDRLVPFSCKGRSTCPSCCGRRMADTAAHLVDHVFPEVPVRQWVLSLPFGLRYRLAYDPQMLSAVLNVFVRAVFGFLRREAYECGIEQTQCGAVTFIQRFGGSLNLNVHFHMVCIDGVYAPDEDGGPRFYPLSAPRPAQVARLTETLARRVTALVERRSGGLEGAEVQESDPLWRDDPGLAAIYTASVTNRIASGNNRGRRVGLAGDRIDPEAMDIHPEQLSAAVDGFNLHAGVYVPARDRARLERLLRYAGRPPLATERLEELPDGKVSYRFKTPWRNGATHTVFSPVELIEKLAALVPSPRAHLTRFHGVVGPAARWRPLIVPPKASASEQAIAADSTTEELLKTHPQSNPAPDAEPSPDTPARRRRNYSWSELMKRVFAQDVLACPECGGRLRLIAAIHPPDTTRKILDHVGLPSRPPPIAPARPSAPELNPDWL